MNFNLSYEVFEQLDLSERKLRRNLKDQDKFTENVLIFKNYNSVKKSVFIPRNLNAPNAPRIFIRTMKGR